MKQQTITTLIITAVIAGILSVVASNFIFATSSARQQSAEVVPVISSSFPTPSSTYFNTSSIDPTQLIQIGTTSNSNPFSSATH